MEQAFPKGNRVQEQKDRRKQRSKAKKRPKKSKYEDMTSQKVANLAIKNMQKFIRLRDAYKGGHCISCGRYILWDNQCDAGHYIGRRHEFTKFNELNINGQCKHCNDHLHGNLIEYRKGLIKKIGLEAVEELENTYTTIKQRKKIDYIALNEFYLKKCRDIMKGEKV